MLPKSRFSALPHRIVVPPSPYTPRSTRALHIVSFIAAGFLVACIAVVLYLLKGCK